MNHLPENTWLSREYCNRWSGRLVVDGKYVKVKGYEQKIPFIYGIDYLTHDIPVGLLVPSENEWAYVQFFNLLKTLGYNLQIVICDDNGAAKPALKRIYPTVPVQLCHTHYLENIRQLLNIRTDPTYRAFFFELKEGFTKQIHRSRRESYFRNMLYVYGRHTLAQTILVDIANRYHYLFAYELNYMKHCPNTTNIIEGSNSHLQARLKSIKGFESFKSAERFLNAWMIRRRTKPFTDCEAPFKHLNHHMPIEMSIKKQAQWPDILGVHFPENTNPK